MSVQPKWLRVSTKEKLRTAANRKRAGPKATQSLAAWWEKQTPDCKSIWDKGRNRRQVTTLPVSEEEFLKDMLSNRPRFRSRSQLKPMRYWKRMAATVPAYQGPWQPGLPTMEHGG
ncbi:hypothetical protein AAFF_G00181090 [Aldrovandia affinis]|uniref:Uncharacterized protein n=1 Tax=Aldrovandia affinis TaxID=143900 RepID=A0AAD7WWQ8_9TELE|nr:hypothetical protein AAFF_G00181090 [Aldrovandia affinis]